MGPIRNWAVPLRDPPDEEQAHEFAAFALDGLDRFLRRR